jgi:hypothetical protein
MTLSPETTYPNARRYVLKLHRDAAPAQNRLIGKIENLSSGRFYEFCNGEELLACFALDTASSESDAQTASHL